MTDAQNINLQLDTAYAEGRMALITTNLKAFIIKDRKMIRGAKGGVEIQNGKRWNYAFAYQVKFVRSV